MYRVVLQFLSLLLIVAPTLAGTPSCSEKVRIMHYGDSLARGYPYGDNGAVQNYRYKVYELLSPYYNIDHVGARSLMNWNEIPGVTNYDVDNEGREGENLQYTFGPFNNAVVANFPDDGRTTPDFIVIHLGINDIGNGRTGAQVLSDFQTLVQQAFASHTGNNPLHIIISQVAASTISQAWRQQHLNTLNQGLQLNVANWGVGADTVSYAPTGVDDTDFHFGGVNTDGVHPFPSGYIKMANAFSTRITTLLTAAGIPPSTSNIGLTAPGNNYAQTGDLFDPSVTPALPHANPMMMFATDSSIGCGGSTIKLDILHFPDTSNWQGSNSNMSVTLLLSTNHPQQGFVLPWRLPNEFLYIWDMIVTTVNVNLSTNQLVGNPAGWSYIPSQTPQRSDTLRFQFPAPVLPSGLTYFMQVIFWDLNSGIWNTTNTVRITAP